MTYTKEKTRGKQNKKIANEEQDEKCQENNAGKWVFSSTVPGKRKEITKKVKNYSARSIVEGISAHLTVSFLRVSVCMSVRRSIAHFLNATECHVNPLLTPRKQNAKMYMLRPRCPVPPFLSLNWPYRCTGKGKSVYILMYYRNSVIHARSFCVFLSLSVC